MLAEPHPCFDSLLKKELFNKKGSTSYFKSGKPYRFTIKLAESGESLESIAYHWTIEDYVFAIQSANLVIKNIYEPKPIKKASVKYPRWYKQRMGYPTYIIFEIEKKV